MTRRALLLIGFVSLLWGIPYLFIAVALEDLSPAWVAFARTGLAALVLLPLAVRAGALRGLRERAGWLVLLAAVQMAVPFMLLGFEGWQDGWANEAYILRESRVEAPIPETDLFAGIV